MLFWSIIALCGENRTKRSSTARGQKIEFYDFHNWWNIYYTPSFKGLNHQAVKQLNTLNAELNPICHMLALLGAHHILHVSRTRVNV